MMKKILILIVVLVLSTASFLWSQQMSPSQERAAEGDVLAVPEADEDEAMAEDEGAEVTGSATKPKIYVVRPGDTLWDICTVFFGDPFRWPKLWQLNPDISNPHLIYPGDRVMLTETGELVILPRTAPGGEVVSAPVTLIEAPPPPEPVNVVKTKPVKKLKTRLYINNNYAIGFVTNEELKGMGYVVREKMGDRVSMAQNDFVILKVPESKRLKEGDLLSILSKGDIIRHPVTDKKMGVIVRYCAVVRVTGFQGKNLVEGLVTQSDYDFEPNDLVTEFTKLPRKVRMKDGKKGLIGHVIVSRDQLSAIGSHRMVLLDIGAESGVKVGNVFEIVTPTETVSGKDEGEWVDLDPRIIGEIIVLRVRDNIAIGEIMKVNRTISPGDVIRVVTKVPREER